MEDEKYLEAIVHEFLERKEKNAATIFKLNRGPFPDVKETSLESIYQVYIENKTKPTKLIKATEITGQSELMNYFESNTPTNILNTSDTKISDCSTYNSSASQSSILTDENSSMEMVEQNYCGKRRASEPIISNPIKKMKK